MTTERDDDFFEALMAEAREQDGPVPEGLLDRVMADADMALAEMAPRTEPAPSRSLGAMLLAVLGGWGAVGGLATAAVVGLWIGVAPPELLLNATETVWGGTIEVPLLATDISLGLEG